MAEKLNNETYLAYVKHLLKLHGKIILIIDGVRYHFEKSHVQEFYKQNTSTLKIIQLPAYSPQLNPIEQVWKKIKKWLATVIWFTKEELEKKLAEALNNSDFMVKIYDYYGR